MRRGMVKLRETRRDNAHTHARKCTEVSKIAESIFTATRVATCDMTHHQIAKLTLRRALALVTLLLRPLLSPSCRDCTRAFGIELAADQLPRLLLRQLAGLP